jgi:hypothetical protein
VAAVPQLQVIVTAPPLGTPPNEPWIVVPLMVKLAVCWAPLTVLPGW